MMAPLGSVQPHRITYSWNNNKIQNLQKQTNFILLLFYVQLALNISMMTSSDHIPIYTHNCVESVGEIYVSFEIYDIAPNNERPSPQFINRAVRFVTMYLTKAYTICT